MCANVFTKFVDIANKIEKQNAYITLTCDVQTKKHKKRSTAYLNGAKAEKTKEMERILLAWSIGTNRWANRLSEFEIWAKEEGKTERELQNVENGVWRREKAKIGLIRSNGLTTASSYVPLFDATIWHVTQSRAACCQIYFLPLTFDLYVNWLRTNMSDGGHAKQVRFLTRTNSWHENRKFKRAKIRWFYSLSSVPYAKER